MKKIEWTEKARTIVKNVMRLPYDRIFQEQGNWACDYGCCIGAHFAHELEVANGDEQTASWYYDGQLGLAEELNISPYDLDDCLVYCGAHNDFEEAFGVEDWDTPHDQVLKNFLEMTEVPSSGNVGE